MEGTGRRRTEGGRRVSRAAQKHPGATGSGKRSASRRGAGPLAAGLCLLLLTGAAPAAVAASPIATATATAAPPAAVVAAPQPPTVAAGAWELMDANSGQVLASANATARYQPASLAKMMTFDLALKAIAAGRVTPQTMVPVGVDAWHVALNNNDSRMFLLPNVPVALKNLLIGMMVPSGDDAALAVADYLGGSEAGFVQQMNTEAQALGLKDTHFENSSGLGATGQYTTAADIASLARHIWQAYPNFTQYTDVQSFTWDKITQQNFNRLVGVDPRVNGLKSGHIEVSGYHLVATAVEGDTKLIAVVLDTQTLQASADECEKLLNWGFGNFHDTQVNWSAGLPKAAAVWKGRRGTVPLRITADTWVTLPGGGATATAGTAPRVAVRLFHPLIAPIAPGATVGTAEVIFGGKTLTTVPVQAAAAVPRGGLVHVLWDSFRLHFAAWWAHLRL